MVMNDNKHAWYAVQVARDAASQLRDPTVNVHVDS